MNSVSLTAFADELEKIAAPSLTAIGAGVGAGVGGIHHGLKEWDKRNAENEALRSKKTTKDQVKASRKDRLKRMAAGTALYAAGGAALGKGAKHVADHAEGWVKRVSDHNADVLKKGFGSALKDSAEEVGTKLKKGFLPKIFGKKKEK